MKRILYIFVTLLSLTSCRKEQELIQPSNATVNFIYREASTKTLEVDEGWISNCNIFVYDQSGDLVESAYSGSGAIPSLSLNCRGDESYKFYCICNTGNITGIGLFSRETGLVNYQYSVSDYEDIIDVNGAVPMTGSTLPIRIADGMEIHINLTSCVALITIRVDDRGLAESTYEISSIRLKNSPKKVGLFSSSAAATASDCIATGDRAGYGDILRFNNGLGVGFYMFENAQGVLLPSNTDCHTKFFAAGSPYEDVCSYIELSGYYNGAWSANPAFGSFTYRFYLGGDPTSDLSV